IGTPHPTNRIHRDHPPIDPLCDSRTSGHLRLAGEGSNLRADHPRFGVKIARRYTANPCATMTEAWPWLTYAGLGAFHGLNPAMGWLFAVALGLHRQSWAMVMASLVPIAIGHAASITLVAGMLIVAGVLVPHGLVRFGSGLLLLAWAAYHW